TEGPVPRTWNATGPAAVSPHYRFNITDVAASSGLSPWVNTLSLERATALATSASSASFQFLAQGVVGRFDAPADPVASDSYQLFLDAALEGANTGPVSLVAPRTALAVTLDSHAPGPLPDSAPIDSFFDVQPLLQIDSTDHYTLTLRVLFAGADNVETLAETITLTDLRLMHFSGMLRFGDISTTFTAISNDPQPLGTLANVGETTKLGIPANGASLDADPRFTFGTDSDLNVVLGIDGAATTTDIIHFASPADPDTGVANGVQFIRDSVTLDGGGLQATCSVRLPAGFGVNTDATARRMLATYPLGKVPLDGALMPVGPLTLSPNARNAEFLYAVHEQLPERFKCVGIVWDVAAGAFTAQRVDTAHVRVVETAILEGFPLTVETLIAKDRPSNDGYLLHPDPGDGNNVVITADAAGRAILTTAQIDLPPSVFTAHFPDRIRVEWTQAGRLVVQDGLIDRDNSQLPGALDVLIDETPGAPTLPAPAPGESFTFELTDSVWRFTADGGLRAEGNIAAAPLRWGARDAATFAQQVSTFSQGSAHIPGVNLRGAFSTDALADNRPGHLLLSGHGMPGDPSYVERPGTPAYAQGMADYAGLNFRVVASGDQSATTLIGDASVGPYALRDITKFYIRHSGVSGIHAAVKEAFSGLAGALKMYGFPLKLDDYQVSYLDNVVQDTRVSGVITVPGAQGNPGFEQAFVKMFFDPKGRPKELELPDPNDADHILSYWNVRLHPLKGDFMNKTGEAEPTALVLGGEVVIPGVLRDPLRGSLGFFSDGRMATASDRVPGVNSRLKPPSHIGLHGPGSLTSASKAPFNVEPVTDLYFNNPDEPGAPKQGFAAFAGTIKVPFFQALQVHVLARANGQNTLIRGGWTTKSGQSFFNQANFDANNRGFDPALADFNDYANSAEPVGFEYFDDSDPKDMAHQNRNPYNPLAQQSWLGFVSFKMPVVWDPALRRFLSSVPEDREFLVFRSQRVLKQLTPSGADIKFGLQFKGLPRLNLATLLIDDKEATQEIIHLIPHGSDLVAGMNALSGLLSNDQNNDATESDRLILQGLDAALDPLFDKLFEPGQPLANALSASDASSILNDPAIHLNADIQSQLSQITGTIDEANSILHQVNTALDSVNTGLSVADTILKKDAGGKRGAFILDTLNIAGSLSMSKDDFAQVTTKIDQTINGELAPTLDEIATIVASAHELSSTAADALKDVETLTREALNAVNEVQSGKGLPDNIVKDLTDYFNKAYDPNGRYLVEAGKDAIKAKLKDITRQAILQSGFITEVQTTFRNLLTPVRDEYKGSFDQIFGVMNDVVRSALEELSDEVVEHLNEDVGRVNRAVGGFSKTFEMSKTDGSAHIEGNVIQSAHIDTTFALHVPDPITLKGSLDYLCQQSDQPVPACSSGLADGQMQITLQASGGASLAGTPPVSVSARGQFTLNSAGQPLAVSGGLSAKGDIHFDLLALRNAEYNFEFGERDNYLEAAGAGTVYIIDADVKVFMGRTCNTTLLDSIDPEIGLVLGNLGVHPGNQDNTVTGYYFRADGAVSLNKIFDIPDSVVTLVGKGGVGSFLFLTDDVKAIIPGQHWRMGIDVGIATAHINTELKALGGVNAVSLVKHDDVLAFMESLSLLKQGLLDGAVAGEVNVEIGAGIGPFKETITKHCPFSAKGSYTPPPLAPPPGLIFINHLDF
ncbi:MAG: hypothetical protein HYR88_09485, partial [Verrucomicrobia bacterium]|nr:hypothetical protein [Verrucomicrobiota bacterium]